MGNNSVRPIRFKQSLADFPLTVSLCDKVPSWGLSRWNGKGLHFRPSDDEGFVLRGDKQRLVYQGRRRSHRFTILGDNSFEYDCILNREPESNVISLVMDGAERFDFFRQPDFVSDPFLKGSYAVYKKETLIGEGTGKLCHIHRPEIIDARGRRCWGELSVVGNELRITIPEKWLGEAVYPVIVDPTIGTTTVGSQYIYYNIDNEDDYELMYELSVPVNRFLVPENLDGSCTAYFYVNSDDYEAGGRGVVYSDSSNKPLTRRSKDESFIDMRVNASKPKGWRSGTFKTNTSIASGSYIWFGCFCEYYWMPRFDWGVKCYRGWWADDYDNIPNTYNYSDTWDYDFKLSMYFTYSTAQNYVRTLTQGVNLSDSRKITAEYKRSFGHTVNGSAALNPSVSFFRQCLMNVSNTMSLERLPVFIRTVFEQTRTNDGILNMRYLSRSCEEIIKIQEEVKRSQGFFRKLADVLTETDNTAFPIVFIRSIHETQGITDTIRQWGNYIRGLYEIADSIAEISRQGEFYRKETETVQADGSVFRGLLIFIRILTTSLVRDFLLRRFLIAREELVLKSCITREINLDSKIS